MPKPKPENTVIDTLKVDLEEVHPNVMYMWQQWGDAELPDGAKVVLGEVIPGGGLYIFVKDGNGTRRYYVDQIKLAHKALDAIDRQRREEALNWREDMDVAEEVVLLEGSINANNY